MPIFIKRYFCNTLLFRVNERLGELFSKEDACIQEVVDPVRRKVGSEDPCEVKETAIRAKTALVTKRKYSLKEPATGGSLDGYDLASTDEISLECLDFEKRKPEDFKASFTKDGEVSLSFTFLNEEEKEFLKRFNFPFSVVLKIWEKGHEDVAETHTKDYSIWDTKPICFDRIIASGTAYCMKTKIVCSGTSTEWSGEGELTTPEFKEWCAWKHFSDMRSTLLTRETPELQRRAGAGAIPSSSGTQPSLPIR